MSDMTYAQEPPDKPLQRAGMDKVLGRGRLGAATKQVTRARVLKHASPAAERCSYAALMWSTSSVNLAS
jgi:hypothetical protein